MTTTRTPDTPELAVETRGLTKLYGQTRAVDGVDLAIPRGSVYGVLGPNGAGKTTTIRILATLVQPDGGTARVLGHDVVSEAAAVRARVSLTAQFASLDADLSAAENLLLLARLLGHPRKQAKDRTAELLEAFDLTAAAGRQVARLSGGMRRRLDIAASIIVRPDLLFLDEPTTGLDPRSRKQVWQLVRNIVANGTTVVLTTQYLDEADQLADRIAIIDRGRVIAEGTRGQLKASVGAGGVQVTLLDASQRAVAERVLAAALGVREIAGGDPHHITGRIPSTDHGTDPAARAAHALNELVAAGVSVGAFSLDQPSLDEVFLALTGNRTASDSTGAGEVA